LSPPNGWNCRCRIRALTAEQVKDKGIVVEKTDTKLTDVIQEAGIDKRTGEVIRRPGTSFHTKDRFGQPVTMTPDAGWSYHPGKDFPLFDKKGHLPDEVLGLVKNQKTFKDFGLPELADTPDSLRSPVPARLPKADSFEAAVTQLTTALAIPRKGWRRVNTPDALDDVVMRKNYLPHVVEKRDQAREQFANYIFANINRPHGSMANRIRRRVIPQAVH